jgi:signal transduction histidine kinase
MKSLRATFFEESEVSLLIFDKNLICIDANIAAGLQNRIVAKELIGASIEQISPTVSQNGRLDIYREVMRTGRSCTLNEVKAHPSLSAMYFRVKVIRVGEGIGLMATDITDLKLAVDELETFIYKTSHNLRGPIASILGLAGIATLETEKSKDCIGVFNMVKQKAEELDANLIMLRESMRARRRNDNIIHPGDFAVILDEIVEQIAKTTDITGIDFNVTNNLKDIVNCDEVLIKSILSNLVDNAVKYRRDGVKSFVNVLITGTDKGILINVCDNGIGIDDAIRENIFKLFYRGTNKGNGAGLGLYIVKQILKTLSGNITVGSGVDSGTTFTVYIPLFDATKKLDANHLPVNF